MDQPFPFDRDLVASLKPIFQHFKEITLDLSKLDKPTLARLLLSTSQSYQDTLNLQIKRKLEAEEPKTMSEIRRMLAYKQIYHLAHEVYVKKRNPKATEIIKELAEELEHEFEELVDPALRMGQSLFQHPTKWARLNQEKAEVLEKFFGLSQGGLQKTLAKCNVFVQLMLAQKMDANKSLLRYACEWVEKVHSSLQTISDQRARALDSSLVARLPEPTLPASKTPASKKSFDRFVDQFKIDLNHVVNFIESRVQWREQFENKAEHVKAKKQFLQQMLVDKQSAFELAEKMKDLQSEEWDSAGQGQVHAPSVQKFLKNLEDFLRILAGSASVHETCPFLVQYFQSDYTKMIMAYLMVENPMLDEINCREFFDLPQVARIKNAQKNFALGAVEHIIKSKSDAHHLVQYLLSFDFTLPAFFIAKLAFFGGRLKPVNIQVQFEHRNYLALVTDQFLSYLLKLEVGIHDFLVFYSLTYNLSSKLNVLFLSKALLVNLHDPHLPRVCNFHPTLLNLFQTNLKTFLFNYAVPITPENEVYQYVHQFRQSGNSSIDTKKFGIQHFLGFLGYCQSDELVEMLLEIVFKKGWLDVPNSSLLVYNSCVQIQKDVHAIRTKSPTLDRFNQFFYLGGLEGQSNTFDLFSHFDQGFRQINQGVQVDPSLLTLSAEKGLIFFENKASLFERFVQYLHLSELVTQVSPNASQLFASISSMLTDLQLEDQVLATRVIIFIQKHLDLLKRLLANLSFVERQEIGESLLGSLYIWKANFGVNPHRETLTGVILQINSDLEEVLF